MKIHIVKSGDPLYSIAQKYHVTLEALIQENPQISNPDAIDVGMKIKIPSAGSKPANPQPDWSHQHVVQSGDTLWKLSKSWGIPLADLIQANPQLTNPNVLVIGEVVNIPKAHGSVQSSQLGQWNPSSSNVSMQGTTGLPSGKANTGMFSTASSVIPGLANKVSNAIKPSTSVQPKVVTKPITAAAPPAAIQPVPLPAPIPAPVPAPVPVPAPAPMKPKSPYPTSYAPYSVSISEASAVAPYQPYCPETPTPYGLSSYGSYPDQTSYGIGGYGGYPDHTGYGTSGYSGFSYSGPEQIQQPISTASGCKSCGGSSGGHAQQPYGMMGHSGLLPAQAGFQNPSYPFQGQGYPGMAAQSPYWSNFGESSPYSQAYPYPINAQLGFPAIPPIPPMPPMPPIPPIPPMAPLSPIPPMPSLGAGPTGFERTEQEDGASISLHTTEENSDSKLIGNERTTPRKRSGAKIKSKSPASRGRKQQTNKESMPWIKW